MSTEIINLTPHTITLRTDDGTLREIPSSGVARATERREGSTYLDTEFGRVEMSTKGYGQVEGLPPAARGTILIVSTIVMQALPGRTDLYAPDRVERGADGQVMSCGGFYRL